MHKTMKRMVQRGKKHMVRGVDNVPSRQTSKVLVEKYIKDLSAVYQKAIFTNKANYRIPWVKAGLYYYSGTYVKYVMTDILRHLSANKAIGQTMVTDSWLR